MKTRIITLHVEGENEAQLDEYADKVCNLIDEAMIAQETTSQIPQGIRYLGVDFIDPDAPEDKPAAQDLEVINP